LKQLTRFGRHFGSLLLDKEQDTLLGQSSILLLCRTPACQAPLAGQAKKKQSPGLYRFVISSPLDLLA
jgi:hypothetical protein